MTISNENFDIGLMISISGTISCIICRFEFWQDRVLSCAILPEMLPTMICKMIAQWMKMSASITRINNLYISQFQLECSTRAAARVEAAAVEAAALAAGTAGVTAGVGGMIRCCARSPECA